MDRLARWSALGTVVGLVGLSGSTFADSKGVRIEGQAPADYVAGLTGQS